MSVFLPVACAEPSVKTRSTLETAAPRPICLGLIPPELVLGAEALEVVCESISENVTRLDLKPIVLMFEILLPITSMRVW